MKKQYTLLFLFSIFFFNVLSQTRSVVVPTKGKEFWLGFIEQFEFPNGVGTKRLDIFITGKYSTTGTISIPAQNYVQSFSVSPNVTTTVTIPNSVAEHVSSQTIDNKGILIETQDTVSVFAINFERFTADGSVVLPTVSLGNEYRITSYSPLHSIGTFNHSSVVVIVGTQDNSEIEITPAAKTSLGQIPGIPFTIMLNRGQSYQLKAFDDSLDFTGTLVKAAPSSGSCRPFAVFSGATCANVPVNCTACDHLFEQEYPTNIWGKEYLLIPFSFANHFTYRILAHKDSTIFFIDNGFSQQLNAGQFYEANGASAPLHITSNKPISVAQFMEGISCATAGDPSEIILNSIDQKLDEITFSTVTSTVINQHVLNVLMKDIHKTQLTLDGIQVSQSVFLPFPSYPSYVYAKLNLSQGSHTLQADSGFVAYAYGTGPAESYAYSLGSFRLKEEIPTDTVICGSNGITLAPPESLFLSQWTNLANPGVVISTNPTLTVIPNGNEIYQVTGNSLFSDCPKIYNFYIEIPNLTMQLALSSDNDTVCKYQPVQLHAAILPSGNYTYKWSPSAGMLNPNIANPVVAPLHSAWYKCKASTPGGCSSFTDSIFIFVKAGNIVSVTASATKYRFCVGDSSKLSAIINESIFDESFDNGITSSLWSSISLGSDTNGCGSVYGNALYFNGSGTRAATTIPLNIIQGTTLSFYLKIANGAFPCDNSETGENIVLEYSVNNGSTYNLISTFYEFQYPIFSHIQITVPSNALGSGTIFRWRQLGTFTGNEDNWSLDEISIYQKSNALFNLNWSPSSSLSSSTALTPYAYPAASQFYSISVSPSGTGCNYKDSVLIQVGQPFSIDILGRDTICGLPPFQINTSTSAWGSYTYQWQPTTSLSSAIISNPICTANPANSINYIVTATSDFLCKAKDTIVVNKGRILSFSATVIKDSLCLGDTTQLNTTILTNASCGTKSNYCSSPGIRQIGTMSFVGSYASVIRGGYKSTRSQFIVTASELISAGITPNSSLAGIGLAIKTIIGSDTCKDFSIRATCINQSTFLTNDFLYNGFTPLVYFPKTIVLDTGINYFDFEVPIFWDGYYNLLIDMCYQNTDTNTRVTIFSSPGVNSFLTTQGDGICLFAYGTKQSYKPTLFFKYCNYIPSSVSFHWTPAIGLSNSSITNTFASPQTLTTYVLTATDSNSTCVYKDSVKIIVGPKFSLNTSDSVTNCSYNGVQIFALPLTTGNYFYNWTPAGSLSSATINNPIATPLVNTYYYVKAASSLGCIIEDSVLVTVPVSNLIRLNVSPNTDTICDGIPVQLTAEINRCGLNSTSCILADTVFRIGTGTLFTNLNEISPFAGSVKSKRMQYLYLASELQVAGLNNAKGINQIGFQVLVAPPIGCVFKNFTIKLKCSSNLSLQDFETDLIEVYDSSITLKLGYNFFKFPKTYMWDGFSNLVVEICYDSTYNNTGGYIEYSSTPFKSNLTAFLNLQPACGLTVLHTAFENYRPNIYFSACAISADAGSYTIQWQPALGLNSATTLQPQALPPATTNYLLLLTDSISGCVVSDSIEIKIPFPTSLNIGSDTVICPATTLVLHADSGFSSYQWQNGTATSALTVSSPGIYFIRTENSCTSFFDTIAIASVHAPLVNLGNDSILCNSNNFTLNAYNDSIDTYLWSTGSTDSAIAIQSSAVYWLRATNNCGSRSDTIKLKVEYPQILQLGNDTALCILSNYFLNAASNFASYTWQNGSHDSSFTVNVAGNYFVIASNVCGADTDSVLISQAPFPQVQLGADTSICSGTSLLLSALNSANTAYLWQDGSTNSVFNASAAGIYYVSVNNRCGSLADSMRILSVYPQPAVNLGSDTAFCSGQSIKLNAGFDSSFVYQWNDGQTGSFIVASTVGVYWVIESNSCGSVTDSLSVVAIYPLPSITIGKDTVLCDLNELNINAFQPGASYLWNDGTTNSAFTIYDADEYWLQLTDSNQCISADTIDVHYLKSPLVNLGNDTIICEGEVLQLKPSRTLADSFLWQDLSSHPFFDVNISGLYFLTVKNYCGSKSDSIIVATRNCACYAEVPTAFSPNGDGQNDVLFVRGQCIDELIFTVYNRWGQKVFETQSAENGWDGKIKGKIADPDIFVFTLKATAADDGRKIEKKGNVSLMR